MPNDRVQTQYITSQKCKQIREKTNRTPLFISTPVKCRQQRENKEATIRDKGREEKRKEKRRVEKR